jgi:hypothetical protein
MSNSRVLDHWKEMPKRLEIKINGQSRQNINQYGCIYNILHDFTCGHDAVAKNRIGCNSDPSLKSIWKLKI